MSEIGLVSPVEPHELDRRIRHGVEDICRRVAAKSAVQGRGSDLLLRIYMAGFYHGAETGAEYVRRQEPIEHDWAVPATPVAAQGEG